MADEEELKNSESHQHSITLAQGFFLPDSFLLAPPSIILKKCFQAMILSFRVSELHMLLGFAGRNKSGRKLELQARAIELLKLGSYPVILKIKNLYKSIQQGSNSGSGSTGSQEGENTQMDQDNCDCNSERVEGDDAGSCCADSNNGSNLYGQQEMSQEGENEVYNSSINQHSYALKPGSQIHASHYPVHPDVKLKKLPFYEITAELLKPSSLVPQIASRTQENTFVFHLTPQQATAIGLSRDMRSGSRADYSVQGQLRFCLLETTSEQEDSFPPGLVVKINNKICQLPNPVPTNKPGVEPKRPPRPVNITHLMKISPTVGNTVHVQWTPDYTRRYVVAVYLVQKKTSEDLLNRLKAKGVRGADYTRGMIKDKLSEDADSEIATTSLRVSLICPLGKMRMMTPCRASTCQHLQCFDASLYLQMNERKPTWVCPVCDKPALYDKLVIDGYFQEVLLSGKLSPGGNEIQLHTDGSWSSHIAKKDSTPASGKSNSNNTPQNAPTIEMVQVDVDDVKTVAKSKKEVPDGSPKKDSTGVKRKVEEIDLTISDSDDEPLIIHKKRDDSYFEDFNKFSGNPQSPNPSESVISSARNSPSLIILDSDSSSSISVPIPSPITPASSPNALLSNEHLPPPEAGGSPPPCRSTVNSGEDMPNL